MDQRELLFQMGLHPAFPRSSWEGWEWSTANPALISCKVRISGRYRWDGGDPIIEAAGFRSRLSG